MRDLVHDFDLGLVFAAAEAALDVLLGLVEQSQARAVVAWRAAHAAGTEGIAGASTDAR